MKYTLLIFSLLFTASELLGISGPAKLKQNAAVQNLRSWDGYVLPPTGNYHTLVIFANIIYDTTVNDQVASNEIWPQAQIEGINADSASWPTYIHDFIDTVYSPGNAHGMFTRLFAESSFNKLIITGDFMIVNIKHSTISGGGTFDNIALMDTLVSFINQHGGVNTLGGKNSIADYSSLAENKFDYIKIILRNSRANYGFFGVGLGAAGGGEWIKLLTSEGEKFPAIASSVQCVGNNDISMNPTSIVVHEFSHLLFGPNSFHTSGGHSWGGKMCFLGIQYGYGLMGGASSGLVNCNGYDRYRVGWMSDENATGWPITASGIISDISKADGDQTFILRDFISTGDVVRVQLPNLPAQASNQYIWLENHKMLDSTLSFLQYANTHPHCRPQAQKGIYAYYQVGKDTLEGTRPQVYTSHDTDNLKIICANGFYDQIYLGTIPGDCINTAPFDYFKDQAPNPLAGNNDLSAYFLDVPGDDVLKPGLHAKNAMAKTYYHSPDDTIKNLPYLMSDINAFKGNAEMSLNTNPAPFNTATYYHSPTRENGILITKPVDEFRNVPEVYLSGLKIEMTPLENDDYLVNISWNNYNLESDVRWTGNIVLTDELYVQNGSTLLLDQNRTPNIIYRDQETGLFAGPTNFRCTDGSLMVQKEESTVMIENKSRLVLDAGSHYIAEGGDLNIKNEGLLLVKSGGVFDQREQSLVVVQNESTLLIEQGGYYIIDGGVTTIKPGGRLEVESCATVEIRNGGLLTIESFGEICIHPGAFFIIDSMANLNFGFGFSTGGCTWFTPSNFEEAVIATPPTNTIQGSIEWSNVTYNFTEDLYIDSASVFNLSGGSELRFAPGKKIIVERGATLNLNDSKLTNLCAHNPWIGIEVWGDAGKTQTENGAQGRVNITDRAIIENAVVGVMAGKLASEPTETNTRHPDPAFGGGIINASKVIFRNNQTGIYITPYENRNTTNGQIVANESLIENCDFIGSDELFDEMVFIKLNSVRGMKIRGNLFRRLPSLNAEITGILSLNSAFSVEEFFPGDKISGTDSKPSVFENLRYGIRALGSGSEKSFTVDNASFTNNTIGIYTSANNHFSVVRSLFRIQGLTSSDPRKGGIYVDGTVMGFQVTENQFIGSYAGFEVGTGLSFGVTFNNTGAYHNLIYNNHFDSLNVAVHAMNHNRDRNGISGLYIACNDFGLSRHAIMMINDSTSTGYNGIAPFQGSQKITAGNTFLNSPLWESHIYNHGAPLLYFYPDTSKTDFLVKPQKITPDSVLLFPSNQSFSPLEQCQSMLANWFEPDFHTLKNKYETTRELVHSKEKQYHSLLDGGDTELQLVRLQLGHPGDALELRKQLLELSPMLSDKVLLEVINLRHVFPVIMLGEILAANPQASRSRSILKALQNRFWRIPESINKALDNNRQTLSAREAFEAEILYHKTKSLTALLQLAHYLADNTNDVLSRNLLLNLYLEQPYPQFWYTAAMMLMEQGNIFDASGILNSMPARFLFNQEDAAAHASMKAMIEQIYFLSLDGKKLYTPDSTTIQWLISIKNAGLEPASIYARNILVANGVLEYEPHLLFPKQVGPPPIKPPIDDEEPPRPVVMKIFPNPALNYVIIDYNVSHLPGSQNEMPYLTITGIDGRRVETIYLKGTQNQELIPMGNLSAGVYLVNFHFSGRLIESSRLVVFGR